MHPTAVLRDHVTERLGRQPGSVLLVEVFIGLGWLRAAVTKVFDPAWWRGDDVTEFVASHADTAVAWYAPLQQLLVDALLPVVLVAVVVGQLVAGLALLSGRALATGLTIGMTLNLAFLLGGAVDPSIFYLVLQATVCLWLLERVLDAEAAVRLLTFFVGAGAVLVLASAPFVRDLDPATVVEDPAAVTATYAVAVVVATAAARYRLRHPARTA